jgi:3-oxoacyl-[acyl-carrier protein] reductase
MPGDASSAHVALVTGANHGIGAATAAALAERGDAVVCAFWRVHDPVDPAVPDAYRQNRATDADHVVSAIRDRGGHAIAAEADLRDADAAGRLFDAGETHFGPVDILVNNATGWVQDTFSPTSRDQYGRMLQPVTEVTWSQ